MGWFTALGRVTVLFNVFSLVPKVKDSSKRPTLEDITVPTAEEGRTIPVVFGTPWVKNVNVLWYGSLKVRAVKK